MRPIKIKHYNYTIDTMSTINNIQGKYRVLIVRSSHKNIYRKEAK